MYVEVTHDAGGVQNDVSAVCEVCAGPGYLSVVKPVPETIDCGGRVTVKDVVMIYASNFVERSARLGRFLATQT